MALKTLRRSAVLYKQKGVDAQLIEPGYWYTLRQ